MESSASAASASGASIAQFERAGNAGITISTADSGESTLFFGDTASSTVGRVQYDHSDNSLGFWSNSSERARIDSSGRLGIGTTSPNFPLEVVGSTASTIVGVTATTGAASFKASNAGQTFYVGVDNSANSFLGGGAYSAHLWASGAYPMVFSTNATERVRIDSNGVVTIKNGAVAEIDTLTSAATVTPDFAASCNFTLTLDQNLTIANPSNLTAGQTGSIFLIQDGTGNRTAAWGSYWDFAGGTVPTLTTTASAVDRIDYIVRSSTSIHAVATFNYS